jgi:hypothetical protein
VPLLLLLASLLSTGVSSTPDTAIHQLPRWLWEEWPAHRVVDQAPPCVRPADLDAALDLLAQRHGERLRVEEVGRSVLGRPLRLITLGRGPQKVLLFSQMHGDEPSATPALLDMVGVLLDSATRPELARILERFTLLVLPMLNPDGAEIYQRRNAQGIDINRDALNLATPEGRALKAVRDRHEPFLAFNLHDQNRRTAVADTGRLATIAVLAVSGDEAQTVTPGRLRAMRACSALVTTLAPYLESEVGGGIARYDEDWNARAFGDNLTAWGTPVVLLESGGVPPGRNLADLARLNFVGVLTVLAELATDDLQRHDPAIYRKLPKTASGGWADVVLRGGSVWQPSSPLPYRADLAFDLPRPDRAEADCATGSQQHAGARLVEVGDARFIGAGQSIEAAGRWIVPGLSAATRGWRARRWLDAAALDRLARHGVATVHWHVPATRLAAALEHAETLVAAGRARLEPTVTAPNRGAILLSGAPSEPSAGATFGELVARLGGSTDGATAAGTDASAARLPILRPGSSASFLVLVPPSSGEVASDRNAARFESAWIDGVEHRAPSAAASSDARSQ